MLTLVLSRQLFDLTGNPLTLAGQQLVAAIGIQSKRQLVDVADPVAELVRGVLQTLPQRAGALPSNLSLNSLLIHQRGIHFLAKRLIADLARVKLLLEKLQHDPGIGLGIGQAGIEDPGQSQQPQE